MASVRLREVTRAAVRILFPEVCAGCGVSGTWMCTTCAAECVSIDLDTCCRRCGSPSADAPAACRRCLSWPSAIEACRAVYAFEGPVRESVHRLKYRGERARAEWCAARMAESLALLGWRADLLVPVPLHERRRRERGYNQSERLANELEGLIDVPSFEAVARNRVTATQVGLQAEERRLNVAGAFEASMRLDGASVILVDDVATTGATLCECARACKDAGAEQVFAMVFAREL